MFSVFFIFTVSFVCFLKIDIFIHLVVRMAHVPMSTVNTHIFIGPLGPLLFPALVAP